MSSITKVTENVRRISRKRELEQTKRTEGCLLATCFHRYIFNMKHNRDPAPSECPESCCYHPDYVPKADTSAERSRRRVGQYRALESHFQATQENWREEGYTDPSPF
jgi:hypothetical protein